MKTGDIVFLRRPYKGYRAVELMERLECRWLVRIVESGLELEVYEDELISEFKYGQSVMEKYQFAFHSEIIGYTSPHIGEVRKAIHRKVEKEKSAAIKNDIELHMYKVHDGIPVLLNTCYLYDEKGCMVHGSIKGTKDYLLETWRYHTNRHSKGFSSTRIRPCTTSRAFSFV